MERRKEHRKRKEISKEENVIERIYSIKEKRNDWERCTDLSVRENLGYKDVYKFQLLLHNTSFILIEYKF